MYLSPHFTLEELCFSETAARRGLDNTPDSVVGANLVHLAAAMEQVRTLLDEPVLVHSGYRSPEVNRAVGGSATSAHCLGLACDFTCPRYGSPAEIVRTIAKSSIEFDQLILEYGWVHLGLALPGQAARRETLTKASAGAPYEQGIQVTEWQVSRVRLAVPRDSLRG